MTQKTVDQVNIGDVFKHFKGTLYLVLNLTWGCEGDGDPVLRVVYDRFDGASTFEDTHPPSRTRENFLEEVDHPKLNYKGPRFIYVRSPE